MFHLFELDTDLQGGKERHWADTMKAINSMMVVLFTATTS